MPELTLRDVMTREFVGVSESDTVIGAVRLMREDGSQGAVVLRGREPVGTVGADDVLDLIVNAGNVDSATVAEIMHRNAPSLDPDDSVADAASLMATEDTDQVLVSDNGELLRVVMARDIARFTRERTDTVEEPEFATQETTTRGTTDTESYSDQSICEACGSLSRDLVNINGQLLCPDCRSV